MSSATDVPVELERLAVSDYHTRPLQVSASGSMTFAIKATATLHASKGRFVQVCLQGLDSRGFELVEVTLSGWLEPEVPVGLSTRSEILKELYSELTSWRVKRWWHQ